MRDFLYQLDIKGLNEIFVKYGLNIEDNIADNIDKYFQKTLERNFG